VKLRLRSIWLLAALISLCAVHMWQPVGLWGDISYMMVTVGAGCIAMAAAMRRPARQRYPWLWVASGVLLAGLGDVIYTVIYWIRDERPNASVADILYLASYMALALGLLSILGMYKGGRRLDVDGLIDMSSFAIFSILVISQVTNVGEIFADDSVSRTVQVIWAAYPVLDAALLAVLLRALISRRRLGTNGLLLSVGIGFWLVADFATLLLEDPTLYTAWMDVGWMLGAAAMGAAVIDRRRTAAGQDAIDDPLAVRDGTVRVGGARVLISLCPLAAPGAIATIAYIRGNSLNPIPLFVATVVLVLLAFARSTRLVKARDLQEAQLEQSERYYQALAENSADAVIVVDENGMIVNSSPHLAAMIGKHDVDTAGVDAIEMIEPVEQGRFRAALDNVRATTGVVKEIEVHTGHPDGSPRWFGMRLVNLMDESSVGALVINIHDVTDRKRAEEELTHRAFHDSLTGLANRALFHDRVEHALQRNARSGADMAVIFLDIDGFKTVNDSRGHESGDRVLQEIAGRLLSAVRSADTVARLGGDEFAVLIEQSSRAVDEASTIADRVLQSLTAPLHIGDHQLVLSASIGISVGDGESTASSMLRDADVAMYRAKTTGKAKWTLYDPAMREAAIERLELETDLVNALANDQFKLVYQPIIELESEDIVGFEALLRWHHPTRGVIGPDSFIPIAEENGTIVAIGEWVLQEACRVGAQWQKRYPERHLSMAVNLSTRQVATREIVNQVRDALEHSGLAPDSLVLEMTETVLVHDTALASTRLHELRDLNVKLAIDDFGTGYSSLSYLRQFPVDILKIDRSFINSITDRNQIPAIVRGLLDLGKTLKLETVAEGIELGVQRDTLRDQHCEFGQGFLFAHPLSSAEADDLLEQLAAQLAATTQAP
jgi:diguanylate cyclase (GGDEF)-like protein/PAS domain S-box-containing protein